MSSAEELHKKGRANAAALRAKYRKDYTGISPLRLVTSLVAAGSVAAGVMLLTSGEGVTVFTYSADRKGREVVTEGNFLGHEFAVAWAGWLVTSRLFMALINSGVLPLGVVNVIAMVPHMYFDYVAAQDTEHFTWMVKAWLVLDGMVLALSAFYWTNGPGSMFSKFTTGIFGGRVMSGITLFILNRAPMIQPSMDFYSDPFVVAWAGWSLCGSLYIFLVNNKKMSLECCNAVAMLFTLAVDFYATQQTKLFDTELTCKFAAVHGLVMLLNAATMKDKFPSSLNWFVGRPQKDHLP